MAETTTTTTDEVIPFVKARVRMMGESDEVRGPVPALGMMPRTAAAPKNPATPTAGKSPVAAGRVTKLTEDQLAAMLPADRFRYDMAVAKEETADRNALIDEMTAWNDYGHERGFWQMLIDHAKKNDPDNTQVQQLERAARESTNPGATNDGNSP